MISRGFLLTKKREATLDWGLFTMSNDHEKFMRMALDEARDALAAGQFPVGCVLVAAGEVVASAGRKNSDGSFTELDHAEIVALRALRQQRDDIDLKQVVVYSTLEPCLMCFATLVVNGISHIVYGFEDVMGGGTALPLNELAPLYRKKQITTVSGVLRDESLALFQQFFGNRENSYLQGTLLAEYVLQQPVFSTSF